MGNGKLCHSMRGTSWQSCEMSWKSFGKWSQENSSKKGKKYIHVVRTFSFSTNIFGVTVHQVLHLSALQQLHWLVYMCTECCHNTNRGIWYRDPSRKSKTFHSFGYSVNQDIFTQCNFSHYPLFQEKFLWWICLLSVWLLTFCPVLNSQ